ncbi:MAG: hypothetical protein HS119_00805 [Flavobacteriales bacterium]|nr:hypothetical protein [Flavobacteriales bacterium]
MTTVKNTKINLIFYTLICSCILFFISILVEIFGEGAIDNSGPKIIFGLFLMFGPGAIFLLLLFIFYINIQKTKIFNLLLFFLLSGLTYIFIAFYASKNPEIKSLLALTGAILLLSLLKYLIQKKISLFSIILSAFIAYISFLPKVGREFMSISFNISLWWVGISLILYFDDYFNSDTSL